jgi:hypothetical protein
MGKNGRKERGQGGRGCQLAETVELHLPTIKRAGWGEIEEREGCLRKNKTSGKWGATDWKNKKE